MTNPASLTARPGDAVADDDDATADRARADLLALLSASPAAAGQRPRPAPRFFPEPPAPVRPIRHQAEREPVPTAGPSDEPWQSGRLPQRRRRRQAKASRRRPWLAAAAIVAFSAAGGVAMFYAVQAGNDGAGATTLARIEGAFTSLLPAPAASGKGDAVVPAQPVPVATTSRKPVSTAHLDVADVSGRAMDQLPLRLAVSDPGGGEDMALYLSGLPATASLNAGTRQADGTWVIVANEVSGLKLMLADPTSQPVRVEVAAVDRKTGVLVAPSKEMMVTVTGPAPRTADIAKSDASPAAAMAALTKGLEAMLASDVAAARELFRQALGLGEKRAIAHLARSYDPIVLARLKASNSKADKMQAIAWYRRAIEAGDSSVEADMAALQKQRK